MAWLDSLRLKSPNPRLRCKAVENLSGSTRPSDTELLFATLTDANAEVRCAAVRALGKMDNREGRERLLRALRDVNSEVREAAVRALGHMHGLDSIDALAYGLKDSDAGVRIAAAGALRSLGWKPSTREELAWFEITLGNTPPAGPAPTIPKEREHAGAQDTAFYRQLAAEALKERTDSARIDALLAGSKAGDLLTRMSAIHDLGQVGRADITAELLKLFHDPDAEIRLTAAQAMAGRENPPAAYFLGLLQDTNGEVRAAAAQFLGRVHHHHIAEVLLPLLSDPVAQVREAVATALGQIRDSSAIELLVLGLTDEDQCVRHAAEQALNNIDPDWIRSDGALRARARIEPFLNLRDGSGQLLIYQILERLPQAPVSTPGIAASQPEATCP